MLTKTIENLREPIPVYGFKYLIVINYNYTLYYEQDPDRDK